jgi:hypothetical protein
MSEHSKESVVTVVGIDLTTGRARINIQPNTTLAR